MMIFLECAQNTVILKAQMHSYVFIRCFPCIEVWPIVTHKKFKIWFGFYSVVRISYILAKLMFYNN